MSSYTIRGPSCFENSKNNDYDENGSGNASRVRESEWISDVGENRFLPELYGAVSSYVYIGANLEIRSGTKVNIFYKLVIDLYNRSSDTGCRAALST